uniref:Putative peptidase family M20/M25/M40 n=1 Tax=uncultured marine microorganism HF4000_APKG7H23 TaxID=455551 RepID=B3T9U5_9ZZZZ|nr:putative peptidase family M20/M25/M40 [uncultured marine microorganism HF4000_APKG7H23]
MELKAAAQETIGAARDGLIELSHRIHAHPELGFQEERAAGWLAEALADGGFTVETGLCDLPTAFRARAGHGPLHIAICAEYDSLPDMGHACGHNLIAAMALGAALGAARVADDAGLTVTVMGTPGEEVGDGGGKILLLERGGFEDIHAAMMVHPSPVDVAEPVIIAASSFNVHYHGKAAHASGFPELGINAADALTIAQTSIGLLRQHIRSADRVHGIITRGGEAFNIIPAHTSARYMVRAGTVEELDDIYGKVMRCFEAGALATGAKLEVEGGQKSYAHMVHDHPMAAAYRRNAESLGRSFPNLGAMAQRAAISTDMGNISLAMPSIHPAIGIDSLPAVNHQPEFAAHCVGAAADQALMDGAVAMAWTVIDMATDASLRDRLLPAGR